MIPIDYNLNLHFTLPKLSNTKPFSARRLRQFRHSLVLGTCLDRRCDNGHVHVLAVEGHSICPYRIHPTGRGVKHEFRAVMYGSIHRMIPFQEAWADRRRPVLTGYIGNVDTHNRVLLRFAFR